MGAVLGRLGTELEMEAIYRTSLPRDPTFESAKAMCSGTCICVSLRRKAVHVGDDGRLTAGASYSSCILQRGSPQRGNCPDLHNLGILIFNCCCGPFRDWKDRNCCLQGENPFRFYPPSSESGLKSLYQRESEVVYPLAFPRRSVVLSILLLSLPHSPSRLEWARLHSC
jgi:hypothetical protein